MAGQELFVSPLLKLSRIAFEFIFDLRKLDAKPYKASAILEQRFDKSRKMPLQMKHGTCRESSADVAGRAK